MSATVWPIGPFLMMDDDKRGAFGEIIDGRNLSTRRKPTPVPLVHHKSHMTWPGLELGPPLWEAGD
jgi:hypothetical protein